MAVKLHRCGATWLKIGAHPCWRVEKALKEGGIEYEPVTGPLSRKKRQTVIEGTGQAAYPAIQFEDGTWYRDESARMAERIRAGKLVETPSSTSEGPSSTSEAGYT